MIIVLYCLGLLALLVGPILARWRSGFLLGLIVTLVEVGAVAGLFYYLGEHGYLRGEPSPGEMTPTKAMRVPAEGYVYLLFYLIVPAAAALIGGAVALLWTVIAALRQALAASPPRGA
jgi:hypothetical protein